MKIIHAKKKFKNYLLKLIMDSIFEFGVENEVDTFVNNYISKNYKETLEWINSVFNENFHSPHICTTILNILSHLPLELIEPNGKTMALAGLSHTDPQVRESAIRNFEKWISLSSLNTLKNITEEITWLNDYKQQVIDDLEDELCNI